MAVRQNMIHPQTNKRLLSDSFPSLMHFRQRQSREAGEQGEQGEVGEGGSHEGCWVTSYLE